MRETVPRMRVAEKAVQMIRDEDPDSGVTLSYVRRLIREKVVPVVQVGNKKLVNVDALYAYLRGEDVDDC